jgi:hypothetical protein
LLEAAAAEATGLVPADAVRRLLENHATTARAYATVLDRCAELLDRRESAA